MLSELAMLALAFMKDAIKQLPMFALTELKNAISEREDALAKEKFPELDIKE